MSEETTSAQETGPSLQYATSRRTALTLKEAFLMVSLLVAAVVSIGVGSRLQDIWQRRMQAARYAAKTGPYRTSADPPNKIVLQVHVGRRDLETVQVSSKSDFRVDYRRNGGVLCTHYLAGGDQTSWFLIEASPGQMVDFHPSDRACHFNIHCHAENRAGRWTLDSGTSLEIKHRTEGDTITFYAGQPDPNDKTHFIVPYAVNDQRGTLDVFISAIGGSPRSPSLTFRDGPALERVVKSGEAQE